MKKISYDTIYPIVKWCGIEWQQDMEGHRKIHPDYPNQYWSPNASYKKFIDEQEHWILSIIKDPAQIHNCDEIDYFPNYAASVLRSVESFTYGIYELECILPKGHDLWPAFWLTGRDSWPPEIDIFEGYTNIFGGYWTCRAKIPFNIIKSGYKIESNIHFGTKDNHIQGGTQGCFSYIMKNPSSESYKYKLVWTPEEISIYYNNILVRHSNDIILPEFFKQVNNNPWMHVVINSSCSPAVGKGKVMKDLEKDPYYESKFELINFTYERLGSSIN